jgi:hypothetical protein
MAVFEGRSLRPRFPSPMIYWQGRQYYWQPKTEIWVMLYAQVMQMDGLARRNVLVDRKLAKFPEPYDGDEFTWYAKNPTEYVIAQFDVAATEGALETKLGLMPDSPLSVLAVELLPERETFDVGGNIASIIVSSHLDDPLGCNLGQVKILRTSRLVPIPSPCE